MEELVFKVKGSSKDDYELTFIKDGASLTALCTCPAGQFGNLCKHRLSILEGKTHSISSGNTEKVPTVVQWLSGTDVESALNELFRAQKLPDSTKDDVAILKRKLARAMNN